MLRIFWILLALSVMTVIAVGALLYIGEVADNRSYEKCNKKNYGKIIPMIEALENKCLNINGIFYFSIQVLFIHK